jgi:hypothetical protein
MLLGVFNADLPYPSLDVVQPACATLAREDTLLVIFRLSNAEAWRGPRCPPGARHVVRSLLSGTRNPPPSMVIYVLSPLSLIEEPMMMRWHIAGSR